MEWLGRNWCGSVNPRYVLVNQCVAKLFYNHKSFHFKIHRDINIFHSVAVINLYESNSIGETLEEFPNNHQASLIAYDQNDYFGDKSAEVGNYVPTHNAQMGCSDWAVNGTFGTTSFVNGIPYSFLDSQSDSDISPSVDGAARWP